MARTYHIYNADGHKVGEQTHDDSIAPALLAGHTARIVAVDGEPIAKRAQVEIGPDASDPVPEHLETEAEASARREAERAEREARRAEREAAKAAAEAVLVEPEVSPEPSPPDTPA